jgi:hypothetical protein
VSAVDRATEARALHHRATTIARELEDEAMAKAKQHGGYGPSDTLRYPYAFSWLATNAACRIAELEAELEALAPQPGSTRETGAGRSTGDQEPAPLHAVEPGEGAKEAHSHHTRGHLA